MQHLQFPHESAAYRTARNDLRDPLWNLLDTTPEGRGSCQPKLSYS